jgi:hypothetical protein
LQYPRLVNFPNHLPVIYRLYKVLAIKVDGIIRWALTSCEIPRMLERILKSSGAVRALSFVYRPSLREFINPACKNAVDVRIL